MANNSAYNSILASIANDGVDTRVEVNQRALIDKILARYSSVGAVYRELLQNSNDAEASVAEIYITTSNISASENTTSSVKNGNRHGISSGGSGNSSSNNQHDLVTQVVYRNNGLPFRPQDWSRLRAIAEGNPDVNKVGAFGVGAYTMFSICEEPLVISGGKLGVPKEAMAFYWKGDSLWTKSGSAPPSSGVATTNNTSSSSSCGKNFNIDDDNNWTSFYLPSRDPYPLPDVVEFGQFLSASLTFTTCLKNINVYVNETLILNITKTILESHVIEKPKSTSWWKNDGALTSSTSGMFTFGNGSDLLQTTIRMDVALRNGLNSDFPMEKSTIKARYASALVKTCIPSSIETRMVRVTKKKPPKELTVQIFMNAANEDEDEILENNGGTVVDDDGKSASKLKLIGRKTNSTKNQHRRPSDSSGRAAHITSSFAPSPGSGRIFIGFRTSQTTGLGIHLAAPFLPTVEREAIDFVDAALREYNLELLEICGMLMRLALEHAMCRIGVQWEEGREARERWILEEATNAAMVEEVDADESATKDEGNKEDKSISSSLLSFASYMARGVKQTVSEAIKPVQSIFGDDDETTELLNPSDLRPLSIEEQEAILLMKSYCPRHSTPDALVGQYLAKGFVRCLSSFSPPVLTVGGVMRGSEAKLPNLGMEAFGCSNVVRRIMLDNAQEYYSLIANVPTLTMDDLVMTLKCNVLAEKQLIRLMKWWPKVCRVHRTMERSGLRLKEVIRFEIAPKDRLANNSCITVSANNADDAQETQVHRLESILYFTPAMLLDLPLPETTFPPALQKAIGQKTLENSVYSDWFAPLPFDIWTSFISQHSCLIEGNPKDINMAALGVIGKYFDSLEGQQAKRRFVELLPTNNPYIPYDCGDNESASSKCMTAVPKELYLPSSDLSAFAGVGVFHKVSDQLKVSDAFLTAIGVRTAISIDFLFLHLDALCWNTNPKPLIKYLHDANLSHADLTKLRSTKYLPAENDETHVYAPSELYFKDKDLEIFPFVRFLQWPASEGMAKAYRDFLLKLGVTTDPPLDFVMNFMEGECRKAVRNENVYEAALNYLTQRLGPNGLYEKDFARYRSTKFLPCIRQNLETGDVITEMQSPSGCYSNPSALIMGFSTLDPQLDTIHIATRTKCNKDPSCHVLIKRLIQLVDISRAKVEHFEKHGGKSDDRQKLVEKILTLFDAVFSYLSTRTSDFETQDVSALAKKPFIPCEIRGKIEFYLPSQIFFRKVASSTGTALEDDHDVITQSLFKQIKFNAFLSLVGVKAEPSLQEIFDLMIEKPDEVLDSLGEEMYKAVLRRIASDPPFKQITASIRSSPFLLGYLVIDEEVASEEEGKDHVQKAQYILARASDIYIVDNSFLRRQFPMLVSPMEQTLEELYNRIGSKYVSEVVKKDFEVQGGTYRDTALTKSLASRLRERRPLLLSPTNSSRPMAQNAAKMLDENYLEILQADKIHAKYTFERSSKHLTVTCCSKQRTSQKITLFVTANPDWFDIGSAIGALILQRCQLEDALLLSQLLESPLETLRYRGFPVDRILRPVSKPQPKPLPAFTDHISQKPSQGNVAGDTPRAADESVSKPTSNGDEGFDTILKQMFPSCSSDVIRGLLGPNPTREKARDVANMLATALPPPGNEAMEKPGGGNNILPGDKSIVDDSTNTNGKKDKAPKNKLGLMGKMLRGRNHHGVGSESKQIVHEHKQSYSDNAGNNTSSTPEQDASTQKSLESMLSSAVQSSRSVDHAGVRSTETLLNHLPHGLERGSEGCEVIPAQNIQEFKGPHGNYKSRSGIKVFYSVGTGPEYLTQNFTAVEKFAVVIQHLASVYKLNLATVAIYYEPKGNTIAFNSNKALYFNLRFFCALHQQDVGVACYSYWYVTFAHELAHNLVTAHNMEHGSFTESIAALYLPDFAKLLTRIGST